MPDGAVHDLLRGGYSKVYEAGAVIAGGHSILDEEPKYGLCVTGFVHPDKILTNAGAQSGDVLFLTKPLGAGILTTAAKADLCPPDVLDAVFARMTTLNKAARDAMVQFRTHACTDVTGFGLLGHGLEMAQGSGVQLELDVAALPIPPEALEFARMGILPEGMYRNRKYAEALVAADGVPLEVQDALYDPQTSGGLLFAVHPEDADALFAALQKTVPSAQRVGTVETYSGGARISLR